MIYFTRDEFTCKCGCGFDTVDYELVRIMDDVRAYFNKPVIISSGCRCKTHNDAVILKYNPLYKIGTSRSKHMYGIACDFVVVGIHEDIVADYLEKKYPNTYGIGRYKGRTHVDSRYEKARWDLR